MHASRKTRRMIIGGLVAAIAGVGVAMAYWTGGGGGSGTVTVGSGGTLTVNAALGGLPTPGVGVAVTFTASNLTDSAIRVTTVHLAGITAPGDSACVVADFTMEDVTQDFTVPAHTDSVELPVAGSFVYADTLINQDACKDATLFLDISST